MNLSALTLTASTGTAREIVFRPGSTDETLIKQIFTNQEYSLERLRRGPELAAHYRELVGRGEVPLILDLGANVGFATAYFSIAWPEAVIVAVEPERENFALLAQNVTRLQSPRLYPLQAAIASRAGELEVTADAEPWAHTTTWATTPGAPRVQAVTVAELLRLPAGPTTPFIAKIDIEGFEADLFTGDTGWIDAFPVLIIELHDWLFPGKATSQSFLKAIAGKDRDFVILGENVFSLRNGLAR
jgi:FkbM family methyltransferase